MKTEIKKSATITEQNKTKIYIYNKKDGTKLFFLFFPLLLLLSFSNYGKMYFRLLWRCGSLVPRWGGAGGPGWGWGVNDPLRELEHGHLISYSGIPNFFRSWWVSFPLFVFYSFLILFLCYSLLCSHYEWLGGFVIREYQTVPSYDILQNYMTWIPNVNINLDFWLHYLAAQPH